MLQKLRIAIDKVTLAIDRSNKFDVTFKKLNYEDAKCQIMFNVITSSSNTINLQVIDYHKLNVKVLERRYGKPLCFITSPPQNPHVIVCQYLNMLSRKSMTNVDS